jgi:hypothetical protein
MMVTFVRSWSWTLEGYAGYGNPEREDGWLRVVEPAIQGVPTLRNSFVQSSGRISCKLAMDTGRLCWIW